MAEYENCSDQAEGKIVTQSLCKPCEKKQITMVADIYCDTCSEFQCRECSKVHEMFSFMAGHKLTEVNDSTLSAPAVPVVDMKGLDMCLEHNKQFLFYSVDHDMLLCSSCIVSNHKKYDHIQELDSEDIKSSVVQHPNLKTMVHKLDDSAKSMLHDHQEAKQSIGQNLEGITNMIDEKRDLIIQKFEELKVNVTTNIRKTEQESEKKVDEMIAESTATVDMVGIFNDILPDVLDHGTSSQKFILQHVVSKQAEELNTYKDTHTVKPCTFALEISPLLTGLLAPDHQLATLKTNLDANQETETLSSTDQTNPKLSMAETKDNKNLTRTVTETKIEEKATQTDNQETDSLSTSDDTKPELPVNETEDNTKAIKTDNTSHPITPESTVKEPVQRSGPMTLNLLHSIDLKKGRDDRDTPLYTSMDFLPNGRLVVLDHINDNLFIYSDCLDQLRKYKLRGSRNSVAVISDHKVAVTDGDFKKIEIFNISKANRFKFLRAISTSAECDSISPMNPTTVLVSNYNVTPSMRMISLTNDNEEYFVNLKSKWYKIDYNQCTYVSSADMLALTDRYAHIVYLYTRNGNHLTCQAVKHVSIKYPRGLCEGPDNSVILCSEGTNSLVQLSTSGTILASHELDMNCLYAVSMSRDAQRIAVSNGGEHRKLQVYQIHQGPK